MSGVSGPMQFGLPSTPTAPTYNSNPSSFASYNTQPQMQMAAANTSQSIGNQQRNSQAQASAAGGGRSAGNLAASRDVAAQGENNIMQQNQAAGQNSFNQQLAQQNAANNYGLQQNQLAQQQYGTNAGLYLNEQQQRRAATSQLPGGGIINLFNGEY